jgi:hypothetical protein
MRPVQTPVQKPDLSPMGSPGFVLYRVYNYMIELSAALVPAMTGMFTCAPSSPSAVCAWLAWLVIGFVVSQPLNARKACSSGLDYEFKLDEDMRRRLVLHDETQRRHDSDIDDKKCISITWP